MLNDWTIFFYLVKCSIKRAVTVGNLPVKVFYRTRNSSPTAVALLWGSVNTEFLDLNYANISLYLTEAINRTILFSQWKGYLTPLISQPNFCVRTFPPFLERILRCSSSDTGTCSRMFKAERWRGSEERLSSAIAHFKRPTNRRARLLRPFPPLLSVYDAPHPRMFFGNSSISRAYRLSLYLVWRWHPAFPLTWHRFW